MGEATDEIKVKFGKTLSKIYSSKRNTFCGSVVNFTKSFPEMF